MRASGRQKLGENATSQQVCVRELWSDMANSCVPEQFPGSILVEQQKNFRVWWIKQDEILFREKIQSPHTAASFESFLFVRLQMVHNCQILGRMGSFP